MVIERIWTALRPFWTTLRDFQPKTTLRSHQIAKKRFYIYIIYNNFYVNILCFCAYTQHALKVTSNTLGNYTLVVNSKYTGSVLNRFTHNATKAQQYSRKNHYWYQIAYLSISPSLQLLKRVRCDTHNLATPSHCYMWTRYFHKPDHELSRNRQHSDRHKCGILDRT